MQTAGPYHVVNSDVQLSDNNFAAKLTVADRDVGQATSVNASQHVLEWWLLDDCTVRLLSAPPGAYQVSPSSSLRQTTRNR